MATLLSWLVICFPLATLLSWLLDGDTSRWAFFSVVAAPLVAVWMWISVQSSNLALKWPAMQLLGWATVLLSVVVFCSPLLFFLERSIVGTIALFSWIILTCHGINAANKIHNKTITIKSKKIDQPCRFVQLSDIHAGSRSKKFIEKVVNQANSHQADAVLITGDLLDSSGVDADFIAPLGQLNCPAFMCIGNHERYVKLNDAIDAISQHQIQVLRNKTTMTNGITLIGIDDADNPNQVAEILPSIARDTSTFQMLLYHKPDGWQAACANHIDLMLAGHTHGGQVWPFGYLVRRQFAQVQGLFQQADSSLYVSPGTGTWGPILRLGTRCEMTIVELAQAT